MKMPGGSGRRGEERNKKGEEEEEYEVHDLKDRIESSQGSRMNLLKKELGLEHEGRKIFSRESVVNGIKDLSKGIHIHPDNRSNFLVSFSSLSLKLIHCLYSIM
ncbi:hypothetical protein CsSME_00002422 [Camellia sinensis var. sinensis]